MKVLAAAEVYAPMFWKYIQSPTSIFGRSTPLLRTSIESQVGPNTVEGYTATRKR